MFTAMNKANRAIAAADVLQQRHAWLAVPVAVWKKFGDDQARNLAALIACYAFVAIFPLLLVLVTVLDIVLKNHPALHQDLLNSALKQADDLLDRGMMETFAAIVVAAVGVALIFLGILFVLGVIAFILIRIS
jgi:uncharacterized BrkB/YihY/UPF0761 family membrane protein